MLMVVLVLIVFSIFYLEKSKSKPLSNNKDVQQLKASESNAQVNENDLKRIAEKEKKYPKAVELVEPDGYINTGNLTLRELVGKKVILLDFWTYSCINCQRTLPYLTSWYEHYKDQGFVIVGVHTPEFNFEKEYDNVQKAVKKFNITYPVVLDNNYYTWQAYKNRYWPRKYLIDIDGFVVYDHIGEGGYLETEDKIIDLLKERDEIFGLSSKMSDKIKILDVKTSLLKEINTPEIYFGYSFSRNQMGNSQGWQPLEVVDYILPVKIEKNKFYLEGQWKNNADNMEVVGPIGKIILSYDAKDVNLVAGSKSHLKVISTVDQIKTKETTIQDFSLYPVVEGKDYGEHTLELTLPQGAMVYTFTFG